MESKSDWYDSSPPIWDLEKREKKDDAIEPFNVEKL